MVRIFCCSIAVGIFVSCASGDELEVGPVKLGSTDEFPSINIDKLPEEGFRLHKDHSYGFDYSPDYPNDEAKKEDSIVYISIPKNTSGYVTVFTDTSNGSYCKYYYCDPDSENYSELPNEGTIPTNKTEHTYRFTLLSGNANNITALCKKCGLEESKRKVQELHIKSYDFSYYDFYTHIFGSGNIQSQLLGSNSFTDKFKTIYRQAIVDIGNNSPKEIRSSGNKKYKEYPNGDDYIDARTSPREYILSRVRGNYNNDRDYDNYIGSIAKCAESDIGKIIDTIIDNAKVNGNKRAIIQINYKTKRFWPLKVGAGNSIEICGYSHEFDPRNYTNYGSLELEFLPSSPYNCPTMAIADVKYDIRDGWTLKYRNGLEEIADIYNANPKCVVFAEKKIYDMRSNSSGGYIGEIPAGLEAVTLFYNNAAIVILPWLGNEGKTMRAAIHELGHTMGLTDINENVSFSSTIRNDSDQGNIMHYDDSKIGEKLRNRNLVHNKLNSQDNPDCQHRNATRYCLELQWDCLQKKFGACIEPDKDPYYSQ